RKLALSPERRDGGVSRKQQDGPEQKFLAGGHSIKSLASVQKHAPKSPPSANFDDFLTADDDTSKTGPSPEMEDQPQTQPASTSDLISTALSSIPQKRQPQAQGKMLPGKTVTASKGAERGSRTDTSPAEKGSVLQRYIERFRHGAPMSREERLQMEGNKKREFWWLESDPPTPNSTSTPKDEGRSLAFTSQGRENGLTVENLRRRDGLDVATDQLQEKADRLLSSARSIGSSEPVVSTEGLGSTSSDVSSFSEPAVRPAFIPRPYAEERAKWSKPQRLPAKGSKEDILYKWRLQRKLECARGGATVPSSSAKPAPRTQAEQEICSRLAAFREKLLHRPDVAASEVQQARVERAVKETQTQMDTAVQTSPPKTPSWSFTRRVDTFAQVGSPEVLGTCHQEESDVKEAYHKSAVNIAGVQTNISQSVEPSSAEKRKTEATEFVGDVSCSPEDQRLSDVRESDAALPSDIESKQGFSGSQDSKYRQFLTAEKPHVDDGGDTPMKKQGARHVREDHTKRSKRGTVKPQTKADDDRLSVSSASERSETQEEAPVEDHRVNDGVIGPCASGDAKSCAEHRDVKGASSKNGHPQQDRQSETDSDSSSRRGGANGRNRRTKESDHVRGNDSFVTERKQHHAESSVRGRDGNRPDESEAVQAERSGLRAKPDTGKRSSSLRVPNQYPGEVSAQSYHDPSDSKPRSHGSRGERSGRSSQMPPPQHSSSPARSSLTSAIGQLRILLYPAQIRGHAGAETLANLILSLILASLGLLAKSDFSSGVSESEYESDG
ncbi:hypothetical protein BaRGS_00016580, partial [Batillaria attramentaria]